MCDHKMATVVDTSEPKDEGTFYERYECPCGATGMITGKEQEPPQHWSKTGEVFN